MAINEQLIKRLEDIAGHIASARALAIGLPETDYLPRGHRAALVETLRAAFQAWEHYCEHVPEAEHDAAPTR